MDLSKQRVNYDQIAHLYDEPLRDHGVDENLCTFLAERPYLSPSTLHILDMGCGTGKQLTTNRTRFADTPMFGMDLFMGMLWQAQKRTQSVHWINAENMAAPFVDSVFHYITNQFSYHHVPDKTRFFTEAWRVLVRNGRFVLTNIDPWHMPNWLIYYYFPAAQELDFQDFLPAETIVELLGQIGFSNIQTSRRHLTPTQTLQDFHTYASDRHRTSEFMAISDTDYANGLQKITADVQTFGPEKVLQSQVCLITISGDKPAIEEAIL